MTGFQAAAFFQNKPQILVLPTFGGPSDPRGIPPPRILQ
jgi:hypothetical protein